MAVINDFILGHGWSYTGKCGCAVPMDKYISREHKDYEIRLGVNGSDRFEIRHAGITRKQGKGLVQLELRYKELFK